MILQPNASSKTLSKQNTPQIFAYPQSTWAGVKIENPAL